MKELSNLVFVNWMGTEFYKIKIKENYLYGTVGTAMINGIREGRERFEREQMAELRKKKKAGEFMPVFDWN
jgi:hypothetical protein